MMKKIGIFRILFISLALLSVSAMCFAERPDISSDKQTFNIFTGRYVLDGNVKVATKDRVITADHAEVSIATLEVWANGHIDLVQDDIHFTGSELYVKGSGHEAEVTGNAVFERGDIVIRSERATFNWDSKLANFYDGVTLTEAGKKKKLKQLTYNVITGEISNENK